MMINLLVKMLLLWWSKEEGLAWSYQIDMCLYGFDIPGFFNHELPGCYLWIVNRMLGKGGILVRTRAGLLWYQTEEEARENRNTIDFGVFLY